MLATLAAINLIFGAYMIGSTNGDDKQYQIEQTQIEQSPTQRENDKVS